MDNINWKVWDDLTFKTQCYRKNFDLINENDNIVTECDGVISKLRIAEMKPPLTIGEYGFSVWNLELGKLFNVNVSRLIETHRGENMYDELIIGMSSGLVDVLKYDKLILIQNLVICEEYRKLGIGEEFVEFMYRDFYTKNTLVVALVKPFQYNQIDSEYFLKHKIVPISNRLGGGIDDKIPAKTYYNLNTLLGKNDREYNEYKVFSVASKYGFNRIGNTYAFQLDPAGVIKRIMDKREILRSIKVNK